MGSRGAGIVARVDLGRVGDLEPRLGWWASQRRSGAAAGKARPWGTLSPASRGRLWDGEPLHPRPGHGVPSV